ncbi:MAG: adenylate/guanylate cyclase domain-containing protein [Hyphomicrobiaceae bacterium]
MTVAATPDVPPNLRRLQNEGETRQVQQNRWIREAQVRDKRECLLMGVRARWVALAAIAILLPMINPRIEVLYYEVLLLLFALIGWAQLRFGKTGRSRGELALMFCDLALMTIAIVVPNPFGTANWPLPMHFRFDNFLYFFVLLGGAALTYNWRTVIAMGVWTTGLWLLAFAIVAWVYIPDPNLTELTQQAFGYNPRLAQLLDPNNMYFLGRVQEVLIFLLVAWMLGLAGQRSQRLLLSQATAERERANLARYFSPNVVDELSHNDDPLRHVRKQDVAVLFVDIVGFTHLTENQRPEQVIATLRDFHGLMEHEVFRHSGTLDKYLGDGLMATFGTPLPGRSDASDAMRCVRAMAQTTERWNVERAKIKAQPIQASFGLHYGEVVLGDIGSNRLEFAAIGTTVNVASRLEALTRSREAVLVASDALVQRVQKEHQSEDLLKGMKCHVNEPIRGIASPMTLWVLDRRFDHAA